ncbi:MAG: hypothetical protein ABII22_06470 [Candidatus Micrarchaeota archaeon]
MAKRTKVVDKWKLKKWYSVEAPALFEGGEICEVLGTDEKGLKNRILQVNLARLTSSRTQTAAFTTVLFRITDIGATTAKTKLIGHKMSNSFLKTFARRGKNISHYVVDVKTKDGETLRVKVVAVTAGKVSATTKKNLGKKIVEEILANLSPLTFDEAMKDILYERVGSKILAKVKSITSMRRIEINKTERKEVFG